MKNCKGKRLKLYKNHKCIVTYSTTVETALKIDEKSHFHPLHLAILLCV